MSIRRHLMIVLLALLAAGLIMGCGMAQKDSGGDQTGAGGGLLETAQYVGLENCYTCHSQTKFHQWMKSRHANFDWVEVINEGEEDEEEILHRVDYTQLDPGDEEYFLITGDPDPHLNDDGTDRCAPCHTGPDYGGNLLDANYYGDLFPNPNIGQIARPVVGCEACHGGGSFHYGTGALPYPAPGFEPCATLCHDFNYGKETYGAHHYLDSYRYWLNSAEENPQEGDAEVDPSVATTTIGGVTFTVWSLPDPADTVWNGTYEGPYNFVPHEVIKDTHFNEIWILNEADQVTLYSVPTAKLGYVRLENDSPNAGMVNADDPESCTASCHKAHDFNLFINEQWAHGAHRPYPEGPVVEVEDDGEIYPIPESPLAWHAVDHQGFGGSCVRCHNSVGFAAAAGQSVSVELGGGWDGQSDGFITCNACHDGMNYPSAINNRLRLQGDVALFKNNGSVISTVDAGSSAVCVYCHQGREDPSRVNGTNFRNMHYLASASVQYAEKGYEYDGKSYAEPMDDHIDGAGNCVGCHMDDFSDTIGGHTFHVSDGGTDNVAVCSVAACHGGGKMDFDDFGAPANWDGDADATESARAEIDGLLHDRLLPAIEAYDPDEDGTPNVYYESDHPYFFTNEGQMFDTTVLAAAYNWQFIYKDPGAWAHNPFYAAQLLWDSYEDLTGSAPGPPGNRP